MSVEKPYGDPRVRSVLDALGWPRDILPGLADEGALLGRVWEVNPEEVVGSLPDYVKKNVLPHAGTRGVQKWMAGVLICYFRAREKSG